MSTPQRRLAALDTDYGSPIADIVEWAKGSYFAPSDPYALVERNTRNESHWVTTWATTEAAGDYHVDQANADDWVIVKLVDLRNGTEYTPELSIAWHEASPPDADARCEQCNRAEGDKHPRANGSYVHIEPTTGICSECGSYNDTRTS